MAPSLNIGNIAITIGEDWAEWQLRRRVTVAAVGVENGRDGAAGVYLLQHVINQRPDPSG